MPRPEPAVGRAAAGDRFPCGDRPRSADAADLADAVRAASALRGLNPAGVRLIHHYSNAVYHLPAEGVVARVTWGVDASRRLTVAQQVVRWLVDQHRFPATAPASRVEPVHPDPQITVTFWRHYPQPQSAGKPTSDHLGRLLQMLHGIAEAPPVQLDRWVPLAALHATLTSGRTAIEALHPDERDWLLDEVHRLREELDRLDWPLGFGLIHGDAWAGNLLWDAAAGSDAAILTDWDWVSYGPREIDLIPTWHATRRYGRGPAWTIAFVARYGYDLAASPVFTILMRMRDLVQITGPLRRAADSEAHREALRQRLDAIRAGDTTATWKAL